jgi:FixJ family two-component response regulator
MIARDTSAKSIAVRPDGGGKTMSDGIVAVIDDNEDVLDSLSLVLEMYGFAVTPYAMSVSFLEDFTARPSCLIVDQNMPGMKGLELVARLRQQGNLIPVLVTTGLPSSDIAEDAARLGIERVITKPAKVDDLLNFVSKYC